MLLLTLCKFSIALFGQDNNNTTKIHLSNRFIIYIFELSVQNDSILQIKQMVFNTNYDKSVYICPVSLCRNAGAPLPGDTNDLLVISDGRLISFFDLVDNIDIYKIPPQESRVFFDKYKFSNINEIEWVNVMTNHVFETPDFNTYINFIEDIESVDSRNRPVKTSVYSIDRKLFNQNSNFSEVFCSGIDLLRNRVNKLE